MTTVKLVHCFLLTYLLVTCSVVFSDHSQCTDAEDVVESVWFDVWNFGRSWIATIGTRRSQRSQECKNL